MSISLEEHISSRKTFAIISHPDAGKTTLTEKLLLFGGAIHLAGNVKARKTQRYATSDWMELERQRGISITSSAMQFNYQGFVINILDTPGHQDFSEDTYRTLTAADSAVMLIDAAKGVEVQTIKLFEVCKRRGIPIFTFVNKMDREGKHPIDLMDEVEKVLGIEAYAMNWPIGDGADFKGIYDRETGNVECFTDGLRKGNDDTRRTGHVDDPEIREWIGEDLLNRFQEEIELLDMAGNVFDKERVDRGEVTPVFFGSALNNFGVPNFLDSFLELAPAPAPRQSNMGTLEPASPQFVGFVFKIQANMNAMHRDRIAFIRICSGRYERGMNVIHNRTHRKMRLAQPQQLFAQERTILDEAYAGDIIGVHDSGVLRIGDVLAEKDGIEFEAMPFFSPENFARVSIANALKRKQFIKGIQELQEEGAIHVFRDLNIGVEAPVVGVVGQLQFEVLEYRLRDEYGVEVQINSLPYEIVQWIPKDEEKIRILKESSMSMVVLDQDENYAVLLLDKWKANWLSERYGIDFYPQPIRE
ncbi:bacterial peptide chain release factor 3 (bRF-3) [Desulfitobacterium dehalogenans ATCC 51507]|uniref:Peptide chain release factor 3 n=1 Tax=Desulfitobacterium dehalogenans (strain ATCC 51507 / DSM 9161 / JW/IU-DC1) TaxID=756499 RepID=I4AAQ1_DESDJ|nr:peptide chain release factor 3 [Desulfitobacterium dehalogenans]AFM01036.1 bacterial peptide chain release factor 3 (bRF-3) [Desulfitobacterium dehalogenans ATCC 51507]